MSLSFTQICNGNPAYDVFTIPGPAEDVRKYVHLNVTPQYKDRWPGGLRHMKRNLHTKAQV